MENVLINVKRIESRLECNGTVLERITLAEEEFGKVCRTCLRETTANDLENYLLPGNDATMSLIKVRDILEAATGVKIETDNCFPNHICEECLQAIKMMYKFRLQSQKVDEVLRGFLASIEADIPEVKTSSLVVGKVDNEAELIKFDRYQVTYLNEPADTADGVEAEIDNTEPEQCTPTGKKKLFRCGICYREYTFRNGLHDHMRLAHVQKKEKHCQTCGRMFRTANRLMLHQMRNCGHVKVVKIPPVVTDPWQALVTIKDNVIEIKNFKCSICEEVMESERDFMIHLQTHGNEKICKYCNKEVTRAVNLENHVRSHTKVRPFVCPLCSKAFTTAKSLRCHLKSGDQRRAQTCKRCSIMFCTFREFLKHHNAHVSNGEIVAGENAVPKDVDTESNHSSEAGEESFEQRDEQDLVVTVKQEEMEPEPPVTVKEEQEYVDYTQVAVVNEAHGEYDQAQLLNSIEIKAEPEDDTFAVDEDEESGNLAYASAATDAGQQSDTAAVQMASVDDGEPSKAGEDAPDEAASFGTFGCPDPPCTMEFKYYRDVINHYTIYHCDYSPFACTVCQRTFTVKAELRQHLKQHVKCAFKCPHCPRHYWVLRDLKNHIRTHTGERPFQCSLCPQKFKQRPALRVHIQTHNTTKEYKCKYCNKEFFSYNGMFLHQKSHIKIKELQCKACNKQFPTQSRLKRHLNSVCGLMIPTAVAGAASDTESN